MNKFVIIASTGWIYCIAYKMSLTWLWTNWNLLVDFKVVIASSFWTAGPAWCTSGPSSTSQCHTHHNNCKHYYNYKKAVTTAYVINITEDFTLIGSDSHY